MSTRTEVVKTCDACGKRLSDDGEARYGGHPHNGWIHLNIHGGRTDLESLRKKKDYDVCGLGCLEELVRRLTNRRSGGRTIVDIIRGLL